MPESKCHVRAGCFKKVGKSCNGHFNVGKSLVVPCTLEPLYCKFGGFFKLTHAVTVAHSGNVCNDMKCYCMLLKVKPLAGALSLPSNLHTTFELFIP